VTRVLLCTSNGVGLGHLTRTMAIARRLPDGVEPVFFTLSQALPVVRAQGFFVEYLPSAGSAGADRTDWNLLYERRLGELLARYEPAVVWFDGAYPYMGLLAQRRRHPERRFVWCRRALWRPGHGALALSRSALFDRVVEPGEYAADADRGPTVARRHEAVQVAPVTLLDETELLPRAAARAELGLPAQGTAALVQVGAGTVNDPATELGIAVEGLRAAGVAVAVAESTIAARPPALPAGVRRVRTYPLLRVLRAFDVVVAAAGYNAFTECLAACVPAVFVPNTATQLDDQLARAQWAQDRGLARCWDDGSADSYRACLDDVLDPLVRAEMAAACATLPAATGAAEAAALLADLAREAGG
jgi:UDP-N-acetylglucosamine--N-acetylmuramyl-(pentapeptide) pyrophosphoryl-undecaprenol N-acetylglucosamine transferase